MLIWLLLVIEFSSIGIIGAALPPLADLTNAPNLARHGPMLPFSFFGGLALLHIWEERLPAALKRQLRKATGPIIAMAAAALILVALAFQPLLDSLGFPRTNLSHDDLAAMTWLRENSPADAVVMAVDGNAWLPLFAERRSPAIRAVRYFEWDAIHDVDLDRSKVNYVYAAAGSDPPADMALKLVFEQGNAAGLRAN